jgi:hypothetical protein
VLWVLVDVAIAVLALVGLTAVCLRLWRTTKALGSAIGTAGDTLGEASAAVPAVRRGADET